MKIEMTVEVPKALVELVVYQQAFGSLNLGRPFSQNQVEFDWSDFADQNVARLTLRVDE